jgi:Lrp/AsnC family transcriptional regulator
MNRLDKRILTILQRDATLSTVQIAERVGLSTSPCWRRIQNLEKRGVIRHRVALVDREALNLGIDVFVSIRTRHHSAKWLSSFAKTVSKFEEVVEFYRMSGETDYLMRVVVPDIPAYDRFYKRLIEEVDIDYVSSSFAMERLKYTTALPVDYA